MGALIDHLTRLPAAVLLAALLAGCAIESTVLIGTILSGELVVLAMTAILSVWLAPLAAVAAAAGTLGGQLLTYLLGRRFGPALLRRAPSRGLLGLRHRIENAGYTTMISVRFMAIGHTLAPVLAGSTEMPLRRYFPRALVASAAWAITWTAVGTGAGQLGQLLSGGWGRIAMFAVCLTVALTVLIFGGTPADVRRMPIHDRRDAATRGGASKA
jgi:membrane-associated protein